MAIQKHNTYYDDKKPGSGIYYYDENGNHKEVLTKNDLNAISSISSINDKVTALSSKTVSEIKSTTTVTATPHTAPDGTIYYELEAAPEVSDTVIKGENGISSTNQGTKWTIGLSADYLSANALNNLSGNWQNTYTAVTANSATWNKVTDKVDTTAFTPVKNDVDTLKANSAHSTLSSKNDYIKVTKNGVNYGVEFISGDLATQTWVDTNYQEKGNYLSANALDNLSGNWQSTYNTVYTNSGDWQEVNNKLYTSAFEAISGEWAFSADVDKQLENTSAWAKATFQPIGDYLSANALKDLSGNWESTYSSVYNNSAKWDEVSAKLDKKDFNNWSALLDERIENIENKVDILKSSSADWNEVSAKLDISSFSSVSSDFALKTEVQEEFEQTSAWVKDNFLSANALDKIKETSSTWVSTYNTVETNSGKWETAYETLTNNSAYWDDVSAKLNSATFTAYSADIKTTIETFSGEFVDLSGDFTAHSADPNLHLAIGEREKWTSAANRVENSAAIWDTVSAKVNKTEFEEFKTSAHDELEKKLDKDSFESWSANKDYDFYSAGNGIKIENHIVSVSADYALSADVNTRLTNYYDKDEVDRLIANFGGYTTATSAEPDGHPDVIEIDPRRIYLVKMGSGPTSADNYKEWIYIDTTSAWNCVGETTMDLTPYLTKEEAEDIYQPIGDYVVSSTDVIKPGSAWVLINDNDNVQWSGLDVSELGKKYIVKSTNGSVKVGSATVGNVVTYDLSADNMPTISSEYMLSNYNSATNKYELSGATIVGENGVSAEYNPETNEWNVGLEDYNDIGFAKYSSSANVYTASAVVDGYTEDLNVNPTKITLNDDQILLKTGFYHVDVQTNFTIANPDNNYYNVFVKSIPNAASITQMIDGSYAHTETVDLSFDVRITNDDTPLEISVENYKSGENFAISNLNIHEIVSMPSQIEGGAGNYQAGDGISIVNDTIAAKLGNGLEIDASNAIKVKLGDGLKFDNTQGIQAITIDSKVEEVVETVEELKEDLDTKITDNFPPAMITLANLQVASNTQYSPNNGGMLIGYLFTCPITHKIYDGSNNDYLTKIGIYTKQWGSGEIQYNRVILGIYEYDPDYVNPNTHQVGKTEALCDTGIIELQQGYAEYDVKNLFPDKTSPEMKPGKFYYASIYMSYGQVDTNGLTLFGAPGYNTQVNNLKPGITITNVNRIHAALYPNMTGYDQDLNFDKMGFSWQYNSYPPASPSDPSTSQGIDEAHAAGRPYFAFRNVKITGN